MRSENRKRILHGLVLLIGILFSVIPIDAEAVRIKDIAAVEGVRENSLIGYGLVIGLNGTGDKTGTTFTVQTLSSMLKKMGIAVEPSAAANEASEPQPEQPKSWGRRFAEATYLKDAADMTVNASMAVARVGVETFDKMASAAGSLIPDFRK